jgi:hypothetical protein
MNENRKRERREGDSLRESSAPAASTVADNSAGAYPTEGWEATYFSASSQGRLSAHRTAVRVPAGLSRVCPPIRIGQPGCVYAVRRWGFALRPSALEAAGFEPAHLLPSDGDDVFLRALFRAAAFDLPGEFVIASPEHPFRLVGTDGRLRGSSTQWRTYLGALAYFASGGRIDADFIRFWAESESGYRQAVNVCLDAIRSPGRWPDDLPLGTAL